MRCRALLFIVSSFLAGYWTATALIQRDLVSGVLAFGFGAALILLQPKRKR